MKSLKLVSVALFFILSLTSFSQVSRNRLKQSGYSWIGRSVPTNAFLDSTFRSFWNINDDGIPATTNSVWGLSGNAISTNTNFIGTTTNRSLLFETGSVTVAKYDSVVSGVGGWKHFYSTGIPTSGEMNEFVSNINGGVMPGNLYGLRSSYNFTNTVNNTNNRVAAILGIVDIKATSTGSLGYAVAMYGANEQHGVGYIERNWGGYFIAAQRSVGQGTNNNNVAVVAQTNVDSGKVNNNVGVQVLTPLSTGKGTLTAKNIGVQILDQNYGTDAWALRIEGTLDKIFFGGNVTANSNLLVSGSSTVSGVLTCTNITGGSVLSQSVLLTASTNSASTGSGTAFVVSGGNNGTVTAFSTLHNGNIVIPSARNILGVNSSGGASSVLFNWTSGDNVIINGRPGVSDITINPTSSLTGLIVKSTGFLGVNVGSPSAMLHLSTTGNIGSSKAPLKLTVAGSSLMTTPEAGAIETNTAGALFWTPAATRYQLSTVLTGSATLDFPSTLPAATSDLTLTVTGAALSDPVELGIPSTAVTTGGVFGTPWVSAANVVTVRFYNSNTSAQDPGSGTFKITINKN